MTQGPLCPTCGMYLRWFPEQNQWGCDRCRTMVAPHLARPPGAKKSRNALWIALGGIAVAGGGVAVAVLAVGGKAKASGSGGASDRDTLVRDTFAALGAGDADGLMVHAGTTLAKDHGHCDDPKDREEEASRDEKDQLDMREELSRAATREKGATFEVASIDETKSETLSKDKLSAHGCTFDSDITNHKLNVKLHVTRDGTVSNVLARMDVLEVGSSFYVMKAPKLGGCSDAVARIAVATSRGTANREVVKQMQPALLARCYKDSWPPVVTNCLQDAVIDDEFTACMKKLDGKQLAAASDALAKAIPGDTGGAAKLRALVPTSGSTVAPTDPIVDASHDTSHDVKVPTGVTLGAPEQAPVGDFWIWPRSDGMYVVASPVISATFPSKPSFAVARSQFKTADGKPFDVYTIETPNTAEQVKVMAIGRNATDVGGDPIEKGLAKLGTVTKAERTEDGRKVVRYTLVAGAETVMLDARKDITRGVLVNSLATKTTRKGGSEDFLASVVLRTPVDPVKDPTTLVGIRVRKQGAKLIAHDKTDSFTVELPFQPKVERTVNANHVQVLATATKGKQTVILTVAELAAFDGLAQFGPTQFEDIMTGLIKIMQQNGGKAHRTPTTIAGLPAVRIEVTTNGVKTQNFTVWNRFQHRLYQLDCVRYSCDALAKSFHFADPEPTK